MPLNVGLRETDVTNLLFSRLIVISRNDSEPFYSSSDVNFVFMVLVEISFQHGSLFERVKMYH